MLQVGNVSTAHLAERFGTPFYVYEADVIRRQIARIQSSFRAIPFRPFYAMKANANVAILDLLCRSGFGVDAVSPGEVFLAKRAGLPADRIWFTCSNVSDDDLAALLDPSIVININSMSEIDRCLRLKMPNPIAIRINPDVGAGHHRDVVTGGFGVKFGIALGEVEALRMVAESGGLRVVGLHAHIGSGIDGIAPLLESARILVETSNDFRDLEWINFGGGMSIPYAPGDRDFDLESYGRELERIAGETLRSRNLMAILEPGRYVVGQSGTLVARVTALRISSGYSWIGCDTGFNHLARPSKYGAYHHILNASRGDDRWLRASYEIDCLPQDQGIVAGNICESGDVFTRDINGPTPRCLAPTRVGDLLAFCDAGAYGFSMASHYNLRLLPPEILVDGDQVRLIRHRQTYEDLMKGQL
ncbi:MAG TPA: diaminopimelate decarboxylase [Thermoanaerobaculia bacterium]|nr:diaminopimelate decarboxylase [Thermoanaerobaculia bacterium]